MDHFTIEVQQMSTDDILLILEDQLDLYSQEEIAVLQGELDYRRQNAAEFALHNTGIAGENDCQQTEQKIKAAKEKEIRQTKIDSLKAGGHKGYWEFKVLSLRDSKAGMAPVEEMEKTLNDMGLDGWNLVSSYTNELGKNALAAMGLGINSTIDQHILIFKRFISF